MMEVLSVNQALDSLAELDGRPVYIYGELRFEFECVAIEHLPRSERREDSFPSCHIWLSCEPPLGFDESVLTRWAGRHVLVEGRLMAAPQGAGHLGSCPAEIFATDIERYDEERRLGRLPRD